MPPTREANGQNEFRLSYLIHLVAHFVVEQLGGHATSATGRTHPRRSLSSPLSLQCREFVRMWPSGARLVAPEADRGFRHDVPQFC
jgi:hypothetical protein